MDGPGRPILGANSTGVTTTKKHTFTAESVNAAVFVPRYAQQRNNPPPITQPPPNLTTYQDPVVQIQQAIFALTSNPASYESIIVPLTENLSQSITNEETMLKVIDEIFNQAVREANFRYTGARMCNHLCHHLKREFSTGAFIHHLMKKCHQEFMSLKQTSHDHNTHPALRDFTFLLGELFNNLKASNNEPRDVLLGPLLELLNVIVQYPTDDNLRCVVQVVKMSCAHVSFTDPRVNNLFDNIQKVIVANTTSRNMRLMLMSVIDLRASALNSKPEPSESPAAPGKAASNSNQSPAMASTVSEEEVYYDEEGQPIVLLPDDVFAEHLCSDGYYGEMGYTGGGEYYDEYYYGNTQGQGDWSTGGPECLYGNESFEDGMDDEMTKDYEQFLKDNNLQ